MHSRLTRICFVILSTAVCTVAFADTTADGTQGAASQQIDDVDAAMTLAADDVIGSDGLTMPERLLLAQGRDDDDTERTADPDKQVFVYVCRVLRNGSFTTRKLLIGTAIKLIAAFPNRWLLGRCEDVISPS